MRPPFNDAAAAVFGSRARGLVLAFLAQASRPATGYAVAKAVELGVSNVYPLLRRLEAAGVLRTGRDAKGSKTYLLGDEDLRRYVRRALPFMTTEEWFSPGAIAERQRAYRDIETVRLPPLPRARASARGPLAEEFKRPRSKDRAAARIRRGAKGAR